MNNFKKVMALASAAVLALTLSSCSFSVSDIFKDKTPATITKKEYEKTERLPGLVCWGSSMAYGAYGSGNSIIKSVEEHMMEDECYIPVANMGVPYDTTKSVMVRSGAVELLAKEFTIPASIERTEVKLYTSDKSDFMVLKYGDRCDGGMTDVTIAGVEGTLSIDSNSAQFDKPIYYFTRKKDGEEVKVKGGEKVISASMTDYSDYVPIICMGDNGGWKNAKELVKQQQAVIDQSSNKDKYVVVGMFTVPLTEEQAKSVINDDEAKAELIKKNNEEYDKAMKKQYGDHYISSREYLCSNVALEKLENLELEVSKADKVNMSKGIVPDILRYDPDNLNSYAYDLLGDAVYQKLVDLGYLYS